MVASAGGTPVLTDEWNIDLALGGSQKCLSVPCCMSFLSVSDTAWDIINHVNYSGYDALKPFQYAQKNAFFPYTPYWHGMAALNKGAELLLNEGLENSYKRHKQAADLCCKRINETGLTLFPAPSAVSSPTVTAVNIPEKTTWKQLDQAFRKKGLVAAGSYGPLDGKIFRLGHMGTQADKELVAKAMDVVEEVIKNI